MTVAREVANTACHKLVADMLYEARIQANCDYKRRIEKVKTNKGGCAKPQANSGTIYEGKYTILLILTFTKMKYATVDLICHI